MRRPDLAVVELGGSGDAHRPYGQRGHQRRTPAGITAVHVVASLTSTLTTIYAILVPALGILLLGIADRRAGPSGRPAGSPSPLAGPPCSPSRARSCPRPGTLAVLTSVLTIAWLVLVGARMIRRRAA